MDEARKHVQAQFLRNVERIKGFIFALIPDMALVEDISQEVFIVVTEKAADFTPGTEFMAWARAIARNKVLQQIDTGARRMALLRASAAEKVMERADELERGWDEHRAALKKCLEKVAPKARDVIKLRYLAGLMPQAIAERTKRSVNGVSVALAKARAFLRECVEAALGTQGENA